MYVHGAVEVMCAHESLNLRNVVEARQCFTTYADDALGKRGRITSTDWLSNYYLFTTTTVHKTRVKRCNSKNTCNWLYDYCAIENVYVENGRRETSLNTRPTGKKKISFCNVNII